MLPARAIETATWEASRRRQMWSRVRDTVMGIAEQAGVEIPGLDSVPTAVTDLAASAGDAASGAGAGVSDLAAPLGDAVAPEATTELLTGATEAATSAGESVTAVVADTSTTVIGAVQELTDRLIP
jgi:hypothetical protein